MSAVLPIARDGHFRRNTLVNLEWAFARRNRRFDEGLTFETLAQLSLYGGNLMNFESTNNTDSV